MSAHCWKSSLVAGLFFAGSLHAELAPRVGYASSSIFDTIGAFALIEGLDVAGDEAFIGYGTQVRSLDLDDGFTNEVGTLPSNVSVAFVRQRGNVIHAAYGQTFNFPFPSRHGVFSEGTWSDLGGIDGIYDAAVDSSETLYILANPGGAGSRVYRYNTATTALVQVITVGGFSGGLAFDAQDRLYVAEQNAGNILRYTSSQLSTGGLTAASGQIIVPGLFASYMCFDEHGRLFAVSGFGNRLTMHDATSGAMLREIAVDGLNGYGIGRIAWDSVRNQLLAVHSDYGVFASTLESITFSASDRGIPGTSTVFRGWVAAYQDFMRADTNSGGYALDNDNTSGNIAGAVVGKPDEFDPEVYPIGHLLSLGNGGSITLMFDDAIYNGPGADFAVFENGFDFGDLTYSEFAYIDVATTTSAWARFPVTFHDTNAPGMFKGTDATRVDGLAGKHTLAHGTPFDLDWLKHNTNVQSGAVDLNRIAYVRVTDAVGDGSTVDQFGLAITDPYSATVSPTDGFELRGVGVIHAGGIISEPAPEGLAFMWYGYPGRTYQMQAGNGFSWSDHGDTIAGTGGVHKVMIAPSSGSSMFRLQQWISVSP